ncbi:MarC family protein [Campylobacter corcagiensis]|uniref:UPF0056 membrane protein n=1 Tax=Campylobacter corcagiensis TaxID=1448857 RepID=A0A7M1LGM7_9BACT|nr:MarC family protein [Campylobacter corcagiensis]QKF64046.1 MarC family membrane protein [Campylobacter corcagiensis]QOQ87752.1 MarC family protein [Campylobacter corcagiensis]
MEFFISTYAKMFFLMTPFFVLSVFMSVIETADDKTAKSLALRVTLSIVAITLVILFFGKHIFSLFGITIDAFKIGAGAILFLTAVSLVNGGKNDIKSSPETLMELAVVPLAIPITIGPGTIGMLLVFGITYEKMALFIVSLALVFAVLTIGAMLYSSNYIKKFIGRQGLLVMSKITGLILAGLSAQLVFEGVKAMMS